jgi:hypothetical protein
MGISASARRSGRERDRAHAVFGSLRCTAFHGLHAFPMIRCSICIIEDHRIADQDADER